jgi:hypothetical protein
VEAFSDAVISSKAPPGMLPQSGRVTFWADQTLSPEHVLSVSRFSLPPLSGLSQYSPLWIAAYLQNDVRLRHGPGKMENSLPDRYNAGGEGVQTAPFWPVCPNP